MENPTRGEPSNQGRGYFYPELAGRRYRRVL
jgi:hypothetical protein